MRDIKTTVHMEGRRNNLRRNMPGSRTPACSDTAQNERFGIYGISEEKEQHDDIPKIWKHEVCIPKPLILAQKILCGHSRKGHKSDKYVYSEPTEDR